MRSKEDAKDYRYFPDPDLPPVFISDEWIKRIKDSQPELQEAKSARYEKEYGLSAYDASLLTQSKHLADLFEETVKESQNPKKTANWFIGETLRLLKDRAMEAEELRFTPKHLADLILMAEKGEVNNQNAKKVFEKIFDEDVEPKAYVETNGLKTVEDTGMLESVVDKVLADNPKTVEEYHSGKTKVLGFLVGQVMKQMKGKANPASVNKMLMEKL